MVVVGVGAAMHVEHGGCSGGEGAQRSKIGRATGRMADAVRSSQRS